MINEDLCKIDECICRSCDRFKNNDPLIGIIPAGFCGYGPISDYYYKNKLPVVCNVGDSPERCDRFVDWIKKVIKE